MAGCILRNHNCDNLKYYTPNILSKIFFRQFAVYMFYEKRKWGVCSHVAQTQNIHVKIVNEFLEATEKIVWRLTKLSTKRPPYHGNCCDLQEMFRLCILETR
jgi:hypothetical protein